MKANQPYPPLDDIIFSLDFALIWMKRGMDVSADYIETIHGRKRGQLAKELANLLRTHSEMLLKHQEKLFKDNFEEKAMELLDKSNIPF